MTEGAESLSGTSSNEDDEDDEDEDAEGDPTPCNSPKEVRKTPLKNKPSPLILMQRQSGVPGVSRLVILGAMRQFFIFFVHFFVRGSMEEPRYLCIETLKTSNLGISLVGGNAAGIFIHSVQSDSLAYHAGLRTGDQILEYNGTDLRSATAEEAAYELAKPADKVKVLAHYRIDSKSTVFSAMSGFLPRFFFQNTKRLRIIQETVCMCAVASIEVEMTLQTPHNWLSTKTTFFTWTTPCLTVFLDNGAPGD